MLSHLTRSLFLNPASIFFGPFLASGVLITLLWLRVSMGIGPRRGLALLFARDIWLTRQAALELGFTLFVVALLPRWLEPAEARLAGLVLGADSLLGPRQFSLSLGGAAEGLLATAVAMLAYDFASYAMHRLLHRHPLLWRVHAFHHSASRLSFLTTYRQHPLEPVLLGLARTAAAAFSLVLFYLVFPAHTPVLSVAGLGAGFFLYMFTVNLHHSPIPVSYPRFLRLLLVSPHVHHLHHSGEARHQGKNFGVIFSFWDRWLGTYHEETVGLGQLSFAAKRRHY